MPLLVPLALAPPPTVTPVRDSTAPRIDGRLDDPAWSRAPAFTGLVQKFPAEGAAPDEPTTLRVLYDDRALYLAIDCVQARADHRPADPARPGHRGRPSPPRTGRSRRCFGAAS